MQTAEHLGLGITSVFMNKDLPWAVLYEVLDAAEDLGHALTPAVP